MAIRESSLIEAIADELVLVVGEEHRRRERVQREKLNEPFTVPNTAELMKSPLPPRLKRVVANAMTDPAFYALRAYVREIGWKLYAAGGTDAMRKVMESRRDVLDGLASYVDHAWNGIGFERDPRGMWLA